MFSGSELQIAIAMVLTGAVCFGFVLHWLWLALGGTKRDATRLAEMAERLHDADLARDVAETAREAAEAALTRREAETAEQLAAMQARLGGAIEDHRSETELRPRETTAELETVRDELGRARQRILDLEAEIAALKPAGRQTRSGRTRSGQTTSGQTTSGETKTGETKTGETKTGETKTGQTKTGQTKTGQTKSGQTKSVQTEPRQTEPKRTRSRRRQPQSE